MTYTTFDFRNIEIPMAWMESSLFSTPLLPYISSLTAIFQQSTVLTRSERWTGGNFASCLTIVLSHDLSSGHPGNGNTNRVVPKVLLATAIIPTQAENELKAPANGSISHPNLSSNPSVPILSRVGYSVVHGHSPELYNNVLLLVNWLWRTIPNQWWPPPLFLHACIATINWTCCRLHFVQPGNSPIGK